MSYLKFAIPLGFLFILSLGGVSKLAKHYNIKSPYDNLLILAPVAAAFVMCISYRSVPEQKFQQYKFKDKPYARLRESKIKHEGVWEDVVIYVCLYENQEGMIWARFVDDFYDNFTITGEDVDTETIINLILSTNPHH